QYRNAIPGVKSPNFRQDAPVTSGASSRAAISVAIALAGLPGCSSDEAASGPISFGGVGPLSGDAGRGSFRFGVATAATQIEDMNPATDWYVWTQPVSAGGLGRGTFVGDAVRGYSRAIDDVGLVAALG